jgi:thioredoxin reductase (NADPH)
VTLVSADGVETVHPANGAFIFIGLDPNTDWLGGLVDVDPAGFIVTNRMMETNVEGIFAAGDVRAGSTKQLAAAVGEGAGVALQIRAHLEEQSAGS